MFQRDHKWSEEGRKCSAVIRALAKEEDLNVVVMKFVELETEISNMKDSWERYSLGMQRSEAIGEFAKRVAGKCNK